MSNFISLTYGKRRCLFCPSLILGEVRLRGRVRVYLKWHVIQHFEMPPVCPDWGPGKQTGERLSPSLQGDVGHAGVIARAEAQASGGGTQRNASSLWLFTKLCGYMGGHPDGNDKDWRIKQGCVSQPRPRCPLWDRLPGLVRDARQ